MNSKIALALILIPLGGVFVLTKSTLAAEASSLVFDSRHASVPVLVADRYDDQYHDRNDRDDDRDDRHNDRYDEHRVSNREEYRREIRREIRQEGVRRVWIPGHWEAGFLGIGRRWVEGHWEERQF